MWRAASSAPAQGEFAARLCEIFRCMQTIVAQYQPQEIAIEKVFVNRNPDSALKLGQARGAAICGTADANAEVFEYATRQIKQAVVGLGQRREGPGAAHDAQPAASSTGRCRRMPPMRWPRRSATRCAAARARLLQRAASADDRLSQGPAGARSSRRRCWSMSMAWAMSWKRPCRPSTVCRPPASRWRCSRTWWCARTRTFCSASARDGERRLFRGLLKVSGVGPKIALGILSGASVEDFLRIIEAEDVAMLTRIPGHRPQDRRARHHRDARQRAKALAARRRPASPLAPAAAQSPQSEAFSALIALGLQAAGSDAAVEVGG